MDRSQILSWAKFFIGWPLSFISIFFIIKLIADKGSQLSIKLENINFYYLTLSIFVFFVYYLLRSFLWQQILKEKGYKIPFKENIYRFVFSEIKRYTPGNIWSFLSRAHQFSALGVDKKTIGISILADIQLVIIGCGTVSLFSILWILDSPIELKLKLASLLPLSVVAIVIFFISTAFIYTKKYVKADTKSMLLHSSILWTNLLLPGFKLNSKVKLIILSIFTYFIFGVGNFFALLSIYNIGFNEFLSLSSFLTFSLLVGYLSFITPMGLGVREGVVTLGLSKIMSFSNAATVSIFTRIVLIASELLFLLFVLIWKKLSRN